MTHHRLFVALALPDAVRRTLLDRMGGVAGARWQGDEQLHCTVRFLGGCDRHQAEDVATALAGVSHPPIDAMLEGFGTFDRRGRIDTLWIGVQPVDALRAFHAKVDRALQRAGIAPEGRAYRPHVTVARFSLRDAPPGDLALRLAPLPRLDCRFEELRLCESILGRDGARYETAAAYPLR